MDDINGCATAVWLSVVCQGVWGMNKHDMFEVSSSLYSSRLYVRFHKWCHSGPYARPLQRGPCISGPTGHSATVSQRWHSHPPVSEQKSEGTYVVVASHPRHLSRHPAARRHLEGEDGFLVHILAALSGCTLQVLPSCRRIWQPKHWHCHHPSCASVPMEEGPSPPPLAGEGTNSSTPIQQAGITQIRLSSPWAALLVGAYILSFPQYRMAPAL
jgi:hypothetical protein